MIEETKRKKEQMLSLWLHDRLKSEEKNSKFNLKKLNHEWMNILRTSKSKELTKEVQLLLPQFEHLYSTKNRILQQLNQELDEAEEQQVVASRSHMEILEQLLAMQENRCAKLEKAYQEEVKALKKEYNEEIEILKDVHEKEAADMEEVIFAMEVKFKDRETRAKIEFDSLRDEVKNKSLEEKHLLRSGLEVGIEELWMEFTEAVKKNEEDTRDKRSDMEALKTRDEKACDMIEMQNRRIQRLLNKVTELKSNLNFVVTDGETRNRRIEVERRAIIIALQSLKKDLRWAQKSNSTKLTKLVVESTAAATTLDAQGKEGERLLKLSEQCRKLETEEEKVVPFFSTSLSKEEEDDVAAAICGATGEPLAKVMHDYDDLEPFWKRFNKVKFESLALEKERSDLMSENQVLKSMMKQFLDGISVNEEVLSKLNPLMIVNSL